MKTKTSKESGFSLLELMVVVVIIGILTTIAIPAYNGYQVKARQKESLILLSDYFIAAQAAKIEHGGFAGNFTAIGFNPIGRIGYRVTAKNNATINITYGPNDVNCTDTNRTTCTGMTVNWEEKPGGAVGSKIGPVAPTTSKANVESSKFKVFASGVISQGATKFDEWGINQKKIVVNTLDGISTGTVTRKNLSW